MEDDLKQLIAAVGELQAHAQGNSTMIEALVMSHPDPKALRQAWYAISAPRIAETATDAATRDHEVDARFAWHYRKWSEKLDRHHPAAGGASP